MYHLLKFNYRLSNILSDQFPYNIVRINYQFYKKPKFKSISDKTKSSQILFDEKMFCQ